MNTSEKAWLFAGLLGLMLAAFILPDADERKQPRSEGSGLFSRDAPVVDPLDSAEAVRRNVQQAGI